MRTFKLSLRLAVVAVVALVVITCFPRWAQAYTMFEPVQFTNHGLTVRVLPQSGATVGDLVDKGDAWSDKNSYVAMLYRMRDRRLTWEQVYAANKSRVIPGCWTHSDNGRLNFDFRGIGDTSPWDKSGCEKSIALVANTELMLPFWSEETPSAPSDSSADVRVAPSPTPIDLDDLPTVPVSSPPSSAPAVTSTAIPTQSPSKGEQGMRTEIDDLKRVLARATEDKDKAEVVAKDKYDGTALVILTLCAFILGASFLRLYQRFTKPDDWEALSETERDTVPSRKRLVAPKSEDTEKDQRIAQLERDLANAQTINTALQTNGPASPIKPAVLHNHPPSIHVDRNSPEWRRTAQQRVIESLQKKYAVDMGAARERYQRMQTEKIENEERYKAQVAQLQNDIEGLRAELSRDQAAFDSRKTIPVISAKPPDGELMDRFLARISELEGKVSCLEKDKKVLEEGYAEIEKDKNAFSEANAILEQNLAAANAAALNANKERENAYADIAKASEKIARLSAELESERNFRALHDQSLVKVPSPPPPPMRVDTALGIGEVSGERPLVLGEQVAAESPEPPPSNVHYLPSAQR